MSLCRKGLRGESTFDATAADNTGVESFSINDLLVTSLVLSVAKFSGVFITEFTIAVWPAEDGKDDIVVWGGCKDDFCTGDDKDDILPDDSVLSESSADVEGDEDNGDTDKDPVDKVLTFNGCLKANKGVEDRVLGIEERVGKWDDDFDGNGRDVGWVFPDKTCKNTYADELQSSTFCSIVSFSLSAFFEGGGEKEKVQ